ncbi:MAG: ATP-dependent helicase, partial [Deltaproteobacteria bacterium]|nr:ATP-dependent helicase [Deltaproteobacteria bacterium]
LEIMRGLDEQLHSQSDLTKVVDWLVDTIELIPDIRAASPSGTAAQRRIDNINAFKRTLSRYMERGGDRGGLGAFLRHLSLDRSDDESGTDPGDRVILTTLHGSKGLEFPVVFLIGMEEELLPHARTLMPIATDVIDQDHCTDVGEERRLAYVGITRAQQKLYLSRATHRRLRGKAVPRTPSRFLLEIPEDLVAQRDVKAEAEEMTPSDEVKSFFANFDFD